MRRGYMMQFQNAHAGLADAEMVRQEMKLCELVETLGFDIIWAVEHHFTSYSMLPDNLQALSYLAGRTQNILLGSAGVILPWNDPLRVAEKICMLDALAGGRFVFGMGRGLARREYQSFGVDMSEARARFSESAKMILAALESGFIEGDGPFYPQKRTEIRPRPTRSFADRIYGVAMSPESAPVMAELGATMMFFNLFPIEDHLPGVEAYRDRFLSQHQRPAPPVHAIDVTFCDRDAGRAEQMARKYIGAYFDSVLEHYEFAADYHKSTHGYEAHAGPAELLRESDKENVLQDFVSVQAWGTPQQILDKLQARRQHLGDFEWNLMASYAGLPFADVASSLELIGRQVLPELKSW